MAMVLVWVQPSVLAADLGDSVAPFLAVAFLALPLPERVTAPVPDVRIDPIQSDSHPIAARAIARVTWAHPQWQRAPQTAAHLMRSDKLSAGSLSLRLIHRCSFEGGLYRFRQTGDLAHSNRPWPMPPQYQYLHRGHLQCGQLFPNAQLPHLANPCHW